MPHLSVALALPYNCPSMTLVEQAERLAHHAHAQQVRKGGHKVPYVTHLLSVADRLRRAEHDDPVLLAAALLHDLIEDQPEHTATMRAEFPAEVVAVVELLTEVKTDAEGKRRPKAQRFADYARGLEGDSPAHARAAIVSCADKIDNTRSLTDNEAHGMKLLMELSTRPGQYREQFERLRPIYARHASATLIGEFDRATEALASLIDRWLPGRAVALASEAHLGQFDRAGEPYILHPLRLMSRAATSEERMVAVLHDVVEDSSWTLAQLATEGFSPAVLAALDALTKRKGESYEEFIERIAVVPLAARVKLLDLEDNLNAARLDDFSVEDAARIAKYLAARRRLRRALG